MECGPACSSGNVPCWSSARPRISHSLDGLAQVPHTCSARSFTTVNRRCGCVSGKSVLRSHADSLSTPRRQPDTCSLPLSPQRCIGERRHYRGWASHSLPPISVARFDGGAGYRSHERGRSERGLYYGSVGTSHSRSVTLSYRPSRFDIGIAYPSPSSANWKL